MTEAERVEHNRLFEEASSLSKGQLLLHEQPNKPPVGWWLRRKLIRALRLYGKVLELNPDNWSAMWMSGKIHERLGDRTTSLDWLARAYNANPSQPDVAREASMAAMNLGRHEAAIGYAFRAVQIEPNSAGLRANLALAYLLAGQLEEAKQNIEVSLSIDPSDTISQTIARMIDHFRTSGTKNPTSTPELLKYWSRWLKTQPSAH